MHEKRKQIIKFKVESIFKISHLKQCFQKRYLNGNLSGIFLRYNVVFRNKVCFVFKN